MCITLRLIRYSFVVSQAGSVVFKIFLVMENHFYKNRNGNKIIIALSNTKKSSKKMIKLYVFSRSHGEIIKRFFFLKQWTLKICYFFLLDDYREEKHDVRKCT